MEEKQIQQLLRELGPRLTEPVPPDLGEHIKQRIPHRLSRHKISWDTVNIIIDLRLSRSVAAAVIVIALILLLNLFGDRDSPMGGILQDGVLLVKYWGKAGKIDISAVKTKYEHLLERGEKVVWYGDSANPKDNYAILMHQAKAGGKYIVTFADGHEEEVESEKLIRLMARMLRKSNK
ncbi:MAG: hypothetical protein JXM79_07325 [Sedimentisphaerales bacterium]|nr:hypothetical protein [Sedimentisphaerales bacterium]